jgi:ribA/ribD-fused uncharacterized protein
VLRVSAGIMLPPPAADDAATDAAANPGLGLTPTDLVIRWVGMKSREDVFEFYGHNWKDAGESACFSNFYDQKRFPFTFRVPREWCNCELSEKERTVSCNFSEKAIMLCKAAVMGDYETYAKIAKATNPSTAKQYGREVNNFKQVRWDGIVCAVAYLTVFEKFRQNSGLRKILLATENRIIAETTRRDAIWGIGVDIGDPRAKVPARWCGTNILGWALMEARNTLAIENRVVSAETSSSSGVVSQET